MQNIPYPPHWHSCRQQVVVLVLMTCGALALAGCGWTSAGDGPVSSSPRQPGSGSGGPASTPSSVPSLTPSGQTIAGKVTLTPSASSIAPGTPIIVTIHNGLSTPITAADHQSNCTVLTLQVQSNGTWETVARCELMTPTRQVSFAAASATPIQLGSAGKSNNPAGLPPGTYRALLTYSPGPYTTGASTSSATASSETFTIE